MLLVGQWIVFVAAILLGLILLWHAARYLFKLLIVLAVAALVIYGLHQFSLLPEPAQKYIDELFSQEKVQQVKDLIQQQNWIEPEKKITQDETNVSS